MLKIVNIASSGSFNQKAIVDIYTAYIQRTSINEKLKAQIKDLCPVLIKGSLEEAQN